MRKVRGVCATSHECRTHGRQPTAKALELDASLEGVSPEAASPAPNPAASSVVANPSEDAPSRPINPYGATKVALEGAIVWYGAAYGLRSVRLRYFNVAGASEHNGECQCTEPERCS